MNRRFINFILIVLALFSFNAFGNGGSVVGNGAGIVESNFRYAYFLINETIASCTENALCQLTTSDIELLNKISLVIEKNINDENNIIFISEKLHPGFFTTSENETNRIAKTGLTPDTPIYINSDLLYSSNGEVLIDFPNIVGILIHELGHQSGFVDDSILDYLGSKIRYFLSSRIEEYKFKIDDTAKREIDIRIINSEFPSKMAHVYLSWNQDRAIEISQMIHSHTSCKNIDDISIGYEIINGYFLKDVINDEVVFNGWLKNYCSNQNSSSSIKIETSDLSLRIKTPTLEILNMEIKR